MDQLNRDQRRLVIGKFYESNRDMGKRYTVDHFQRMKVPLSSIYDVIQRVENNISLQRRPGQGRVPKLMTKTKVNQLIKKVDGRKGISQIKLALNYGIDRSYISKILKKNGVNYFKRQTKPKQTEKQKQVIKTRIIKLSKNQFRPTNGMDIIMDDESYFPMSGENIPGNDGYYSRDKSTVSSDVQNKSKTKFPLKILVWVAISPSGHSRLYFAPRNCSITSEVYSNECISKRLVPFIKKYYPTGKYVFWPDGASAHYAKNTINTFNRQNINFIPRDENPPNIPQLRQIEVFWAHLKTKVYDKDWKAKNYEHLISRIRSKMREFSPEYFQSLLSRCKTKIRKAADMGSEYMFS